MGRPRGSKTRARVVNDARVVRRGTAMPLPVFQTITGLGRKGLAEAQDRGLRVRRLPNGRGVVLGDDYLDWLETQ